MEVELAVTKTTVGYRMDGFFELGFLVLSRWRKRWFGCTAS